MTYLWMIIARSEWTVDILTHICLQCENEYECAKIIKNNPDKYELIHEGCVYIDKVKSVIEKQNPELIKNYNDHTYEIDAPHYHDFIKKIKIEIKKIDCEYLIDGDIDKYSFRILKIDL